MNIRYENFIGVYEDVLLKEQCEAIINYFEQMAAAGFTETRAHTEGSKKLEKDDFSLFCHDANVIAVNGSGNISRQINNALNSCYTEYCHEFSALQKASTHGSYNVKIQKTVVGGGYHTWHYENSARIVCNRIAAWTLYLNDVQEGGETEFLYLSKRIKPKAGMLLIWPAGFTHTHRGNPPLSETKYIATGWIEF